MAPYGEVGEPRTGTSWQAHAAKPGGGGVPNFVTCIPLARKRPGDLLKPSSRDETDTETVNFVAPSFYASGPGGTCPSAATTAAVSAFIVAASPRKPTPVQITQLLRETVTIDKAALTSLTEIGEAEIAGVKAAIARLLDPAQNGGQRKLDAAGVLSLQGIQQRLAAEASPAATETPE